MTCGIFQICFYDNLFNPDENRKIQNKKRLKKRTIETLLNELFALEDTETNEATLNIMLTKAILQYSRIMLQK